MTPLWPTSRTPVADREVAQYSHLPGNLHEVADVGCLPAMPACAAIMVPRPMRTLCAICTRLSMQQPWPITVSGPAPRSMVVLAPISTSSSMSTRPSWGTRTLPLLSAAKPKPSWPIRPPGKIDTREPTRQWLSEALAPIRVSSPISTAGPDRRVGADQAASADARTRLDDGAGFDATSRADHGCGVDDRRRMNTRHPARAPDGTSLPPARRTC